MRVFVTGGTGLVGGRLVKMLHERGDQVVGLTRRPEVAKQAWGDQCTVVTGDPMHAGPWMDAISGCDAVVHLAGEGIFNRRWNQEFKDLLYKSRIKSTDNIVAALGKSAEKPRVLVNASAIGYYGPHGTEELSEESQPGHDFLAKICVDWERAAEVASIHGVRVVMVRIGVVLDAAGGALTKMLTPFKMFVGGPIGSGAQYISWVHNDDLCGMILFALDHAEITGPLNGTAPRPVTNRDFSTALGKVLGRPSFMPTPAFALRVALGEVAGLITEGQNVLPRKALAAGYPFKFTEVEPALRALLAR